MRIKKSQRAAEREAKEALKAKKGKGLYRRIKKTLNRYRNMIPGLRDPPQPPYIPEPGIDEPSTSALTRGVTKEQQERLERERALEEAERALERRKREEYEAAKAADEEAKRKKSEEEARRRLKELEEEEKSSPKWKSPRRSMFRSLKSYGLPCQPVAAFSVD